MKKRILVVDDEEVLRSLIKDVLERDDFEVVMAANGKEALETAWKICPDLALIDIGLPDMSGWEVCGRLKQDFRTSAVVLVVLSGQVANTDGEAMKKYGITHLIRKPYDAVNLAPMLRSLLDDAAKKGGTK